MPLSVSQRRGTEAEMIIYIKRKDGRTTGIEMEVSREATLAKIAESIDGNDWGYVEDRLATADVASGSWEAAEVYGDFGQPIAVIRLAPIVDVGSRLRAERQVQIYIDGEVEPYVFAESIEVPEGLR